MSNIKSYLLEDHSTDGKRDGEGSVVEFADGSLYFMYTHFDGGGDNSPAKLVSRRSRDGGESWSEPEVVFEPESSWLNIMSVSLLRLKDGRIGCVFLVKPCDGECFPYWTVSEDEAKSWSAPRSIAGDYGHYMIKGNISGHHLFISKLTAGFYVVNNDRLIQLKSGRLLVPYHYFIKPPSDNIRQPRCGCLMSDDGGETWLHGREEIDVKPENYYIPENVRHDPLPVLRLMTYHLVCVQEPGVVELSDGRVLMWARSDGGCAYAAISSDGGETWKEPFKALCDIPMPKGPATIKRLPGNNRLVMLHNDRSGIPFGGPGFHWRTPLSVAVSDDDGATWKAHEPLVGDDSRNYCYFSLLFFGEKSIISTYEGTSTVDDEGNEVRRNLLSLRVLVVDKKWWLT